ncbi:hypothetical protein JCM19233_5507 [Vibrio astriarenae]|nr:hypothetical protein JCM19233_5507 [Vibrio sp. C7]
MIDFLLPSLLAGLGVALIAGPLALLSCGAAWPILVTPLPTPR